jgi:Rrf2 family nitric oxide-sensitive transcriptional repressor
LIKIVQRLGHAGFLVTVRGRMGGVRLGRPAGEINVGEVVRVTEPDFRMVECFQQEDNHCVITRVCGLRHVLANALQAYLDVLDGYTLQDLVEKPTALSRALAGGLDAGEPISLAQLHGKRPGPGQRGASERTTK